MAAPSEPRVGVNPVSALTPGILRRIFEPVAAAARRRDAGARNAAARTSFDPSRLDADARRMRMRRRGAAVAATPCALAHAQQRVLLLAE